jgi:PKD repeat protein
MKTWVILLVGWVVTGSAFAQNGPVKNCATMEQDSINRLRFPQRGTLDEFEMVIQRKLRDPAFRAGARTQGVVVSFPVIVHVVHNGEAVGTGTNISLAQVQAQIAVLNEDFRRMSGTPGFNNSPVGADIEIEFCLSPVDQAGNPMAEPGIHRYRGAQSTWTRAQIDGSLKPSTIWNPNQFFNIWTLKFGGEDSNLLGYAQFPDQSGLTGLNQTGGPASTDGVVVQFSSFGSVDKGNFPVMQPPYNRGRTLTHETGHWLGLRHIWGDGPCANDFVDDTPTAHAENRGCPVTKLSCDGANNEMPQNYMDYSDDACMNIFTVGQKTRIAAVMELSPRRKSATQNGLCTTVIAGPPVAAFTSDKQEVLSGGEVTFTDLSSNFPTQWNWTFEGGDPNTSNLQNPHVTYSAAGTYRVALVASNSQGQSAPLTIEDYITVSTEGLCNTLTNFDPQFTPSILKLSAFGNYQGYLTGHNSAKSKALSEFFINPQGYAYISAVNIRFGKAITTKDDARIVVTVWNARGVQSAPGSIIERKEVLFKQIKEDIANNRPTHISFDRETPVFSRPFHVGVELTYAGDSVAVVSSANGEATNSTSWVQSSTGNWAPYSIAYGANIAMDISPEVGMMTSVQVAASKIYIVPGEEVVLNARGATIFVWSATDNSVQDVPGPQLIVRPTATTTYETTGSGQNLCNEIALTTIYVKEGPVTGIEEIPESSVSLSPNPGNSKCTLTFDGSYEGPVMVESFDIYGRPAHRDQLNKSQGTLTHELSFETKSAGLYLIRLTAGSYRALIKWVNTGN